MKEFSMAKIPIGTIVATRDLEFIHQDGSIEDVTIEIGAPIPDPGPDAKGDWCCPWRVRGDVQASSMAFFGVDSLQALTLTLQFLPVELDQWRRRESGTFMWHGQKDLGLVARSSSDAAEKAG